MTTILTSLHGRELGLDKDRYLTGPVGTKQPEVWTGTSGSEYRIGDYTQTTATVSSTATAIAAGGMTEITSTAAKTWSLTEPTIANSRKVLSQTSSSTAAKDVVSANSLPFDGLNHIARFVGRGGALVLIWKSSAAGYMVESMSANCSLSTA